ncbi:Uncharacterised protein [Mycobacteroides abscessus subsp. abscessus]|nr:Uncharacterised protein [Mycobacteroides abscessus subsp. abscessus]
MPVIRHSSRSFKARLGVLFTMLFITFRQEPTSSVPVRRSSTCMAADSWLVVQPLIAGSQGCWLASCECLFIRSSTASCLISALAHLPKMLFLPIGSCWRTIRE